MDFQIAVLCLLASAAALPPRDPCVCARNFAPVCGSDGKTYSNECVMNCHNHKHSTEITVEHEGRCKEENCICTLQYEPVCGNDGKTYGNRCALLCQRSKNPDVDVAYEGECSDKHEVDPPCICTEQLEPVCGSDENTYDNPCLLNCATAKNPMLSIAHQGKCDNKVKVAEPWQGKDNGDGKVVVAIPVWPPQNNQVEVAEPQNDKVQVAEPQISQVTVAEPQNDQPQNDQVQVAEPGNDQVQVAEPGNDQVQVAEPGNDQVQVAYPGNTKVKVALPEIDKEELAKHQSALAENEKVHVANPDNYGCVCPKLLKPVCGSDGVLYNNDCLMRCAGASVDLARNSPCYVDLARNAA